MSGVRCQVTIRCQVPGARCQVPGVRCQVSGVKCQVPGVKCGRRQVHGSFVFDVWPSVQECSVSGQ